MLFYQCFSFDREINNLKFGANFKLCLISNMLLDFLCLGGPFQWRRTYRGYYDWFWHLCLTWQSSGTVSDRLTKSETPYAELRPLGARTCGWCNPTLIHSGRAGRGSGLVADVWADVKIVFLLVLVLVFHDALPSTRAKKKNSCPRPRVNLADRIGT